MGSPLRPSHEGLARLVDAGAKPKVVSGGGERILEKLGGQPANQLHLNERAEPHLFRHCEEKRIASSCDEDRKALQRSHVVKLLLRAEPAGVTLLDVESLSPIELWLGCFLAPCEPLG